MTINPMNHPMNGTHIQPQNPDFDLSRSVSANAFFSSSSSRSSIRSSENNNDNSMSNLFFDEVDVSNSSTLSVEEEPPPNNNNASYSAAPAAARRQFFDDETPSIRRAKRFLILFIIVLVGVIAGLAVGLSTLDKDEVHNNPKNVVIDDAGIGIRGSKNRGSPMDLAENLESVTSPSTGNTKNNNNNGGNGNGNNNDNNNNGVIETQLEKDLTTSDTSPTVPYFVTTLISSSVEEEQTGGGDSGTSELSTEELIDVLENMENEDVDESTDDDEIGDGGDTDEDEDFDEELTGTPSTQTTIDDNGTNINNNECKPSIKFHQNLIPNNPKITCDGCIPQVSIDGDTAAIQYDDKIFYFLNENGAWKQTTKGYVIGDIADEDMPFALSGSISVVGDVENRAAYIIDRNLLDSLKEVVKVDPPKDIGSEEKFGYSVDVHRDVMVVGAPFGREKTLAGTAYVYRRMDGGAWDLDAELDSTSWYFGQDVAIGDNIIAISGFHNQERTLFLFEYDPTLKMWKELHHIQHIDHDCDGSFGASLAFTDDNGLVVGCPSEDSDAGALYYYVLSNGKYEFLQRIAASDTSEDDFFGDQVSVSKTTMLVGAPGAESHGRAYIFELVDDVWAEVGNIHSPFREDSFGDNLAISGNKLIVASENGAYYYTLESC